MRNQLFYIMSLLVLKVKGIIIKFLANILKIGGKINEKKKNE